MIYAPGFAEAFVTIVLTCRGIFFLEKLDKNATVRLAGKETPRNRMTGGILVCSMCTCLLAFGGEERGYYLRVLLLGVVGSGLIAAWIMDVETHMIYNFVWYISGFAAALLLLLSGNFFVVWRDVLCFILLQEILFARMYGRADCHGFCVCALTQGAFGMKMQDYLIQMLIALVLLTAVQLVRHNVTREGRLKEQVPFLPYIAAAFGIWLHINV